jgi:3-dehydroquinate dehydratase/shikimate dehydrogenase
MTRRPPTTPRTLICVPIMVQEIDDALHDAQQAKIGGADLVEFRIDDFFTGDANTAEREDRELFRLVAGSPLACIVTCRSQDEGGHYDGSDEARISLYERLGTASGKIGDLSAHPPRYLDIEAATYQRSANLAMKVDLAITQRQTDDAPYLIASMHDFQTRPTDLLRRLSAARTIRNASILKIAYRARSLRDSLELLDLCRESDRPTIALGMGEYGTLSRVLAPKFGGFLTFASLGAQSATAPGQPTLAELTDLYRFRSINPATGVYGIIGSPVTHSLSPKVHNAGFELLKHNAVYVPLPIAGSVDPETSYASFKATVLDLVHHSQLDFCGASVTLPHKENLVRLAREQSWKMDDLSTVCGSANTLVIARAGSAIPRCHIANTDASAALSLVQELIPDVRGTHVLIVGAGGVGRALAFACALRGARVTIANRTFDKAVALAAEMQGKIPGSQVCASHLDQLANTFDIVMQCTSVGMTGATLGQSPLPAEFWQGTRQPVVLETIYSPHETKLLHDAAAAGCHVIHGRDMFINQAVRQMQLWVPSASDQTASLMQLYESATRALT